MSGPEPEIDQINRNAMLPKAMDLIKNDSEIRRIATDWADTQNKSVGVNVITVTSLNNAKHNNKDVRVLKISLEKDVPRDFIYEISFEPEHIWLMPKLSKTIGFKLKLNNEIEYPAPFNIATCFSASHH